ncbi:MAG: sigma 54-interacting transcriptional regulator [Desulfovibrio sp.]|nr:sigma 54-interacting transcriptional regulator [Desulfovibrio sp.]MBI4957870.1 sigma 54-interacting transcriptional regulator [Desulfovibrio sp.]
MLPQYFEQFLDAFNEAVCISDKNGVIVHLNAKHSELTGLPRHELIGKSVFELVDRGHFDVVLNPFVIKEKRPATRVQNLENGTKVVLDGHPIFNSRGDVDMVVTFIRDVTTLLELKEQITAQKELLETFKNLQNPEYEKLKNSPRVVHSRAMKKVFGQMGIIAATDATVLLLGNTGVGKDVFARRLHATSPRADRPFIKADCGSMPENLVETELFGYAPGTFSGGSKQGKAGLIEAANTGTLFLDEIGELPMTMQSRLLRVLQDWEIMRVGSTVSQKVDVRIIAATNKDLEREVAEGRFRSDLYYRLKVAVIRIPTLAKRKADILPLAHCFLEFYSSKYRRSMTLSPGAESVLTEYEWPGNVRELENLIHGLVVTIGKNVIEARDLPIARSATRKRDLAAKVIRDVDIEGKSYKDILRELETSIIQTGLNKYGSITEVAKHFKVDRTTIFRKVKEMEKYAASAAEKV